MQKEICTSIFQHLRFIDRFTCLFVCKDWSKWMKSCLFDGINLEDVETRSDIVTCFKTYTGIANQVVYFSSVLEPPKMPNLKRVILPITSDLEDAALHLMIEVDESSSICITWHIPKYQSLFNSSLVKTIPPKSTFIIPSLNCTTGDLDILHQNVPHLKALWLSDFKPTISENVSTIPVQLTELCIHLDKSMLHVSQESVLCNLLDYIARKYRGITSLSITIEDIKYIYRVGFIRSYEIRHTLLSILGQNPQLTCLDQMLCNLSRAFMKNIDKLGIHLKAITLYVDIATVADQCKDLFNSKQRHSINRVKVFAFDDLITTTKTNVHDNFKQIQMLKIFRRMRNLTHFTLEADELRPFCLTTLMHSLALVPQLQGMALVNVRVFSKNVVPDIPTLLEIKRIEVSKLRIYSVKEFESANKIIRAAILRCPDLEEFVIHFDTIYGLSSSFELFLDFTLTRLKSISFSMDKFYKNHCFCVYNKTTEQTTFYNNDLVKVESPTNLEHGFLTTIYIKQPILLNSMKV